MGFKTTDGLMRHLRSQGIDISGTTQKRQLINTGYYHGYKGYRFFKEAKNKLPFKNYNEIYATIRYDEALKSLLYSKMLFIETAIKNIALESIMVNANSENIQIICDKVVCGFKNAPKNASAVEKKKLQLNKLKLKNSIQSSIVKAYRSENPAISHFYDHAGHSDVPIWALFEIMMMGDLGNFLSCLIYDVRDDISKRLGFNLSCDTNRQLVYKYVYALKDLRNAIAHNSVIFDTRFRNIEPTSAMKQCLILEIGLSYVNFKTIGDYIILVCYFLKILRVPRKQILSFIKDYEKITSEYSKTVNSGVINCW